MADHFDVAGYVLGTLTEAEAAAFETHLASCARCSSEVAELGGLPSLLAGAELAPPAALRQRTLDAIRTEAAGGRAPGGAWPGPAAGEAPGATVLGAGRWLGAGRSPTAGQVPGVGEPGAERAGRPPGGAPPPGDVVPADGVVTPLRPRQRATRWIGAAAAALLLVAAASVGFVLLGGDGGGTTTVALVAADVGTGSGSAVVKQLAQGREVRLSVSGLPPNPPGTYYECWFVGPGDTEQQPNRVSAGTFTVGAGGSATVQMISAADPARFPKMGVTLEPDDGNPARTGPKYLVTAP